MRFGRLVGLLGCLRRGLRVLLVAKNSYSEEKL